MSTSIILDLLEDAKNSKYSFFTTTGYFNQKIVDPNGELEPHKSVDAINAANFDAVSDSPEQEKKDFEKKVKDKTLNKDK